MKKLSYMILMFVVVMLLSAGNVLAEETTEFPGPEWMESQYVYVNQGTSVVAEFQYSPFGPGIMLDVVVTTYNTDNLSQGSIPIAEKAKIGSGEYVNGVWKGIGNFEGNIILIDKGKMRVYGSPLELPELK